VAYELNGRRLDEMPLDLDDLGQVRPVFEELPGWSDTGTASGDSTLTEAALPPNARAFLDRVSGLVNTPVWVASVGPGRLETIVRQNPWQDGPWRTAP
jgi:adenylosuccinate synthase